jgi:serine/threonine-protein kinase
MKASLQGGVPLPICDAANPRGVAWGDNGTIILANNFGTDGLSQVPASGGKPQSLTTKYPTTAEEAHRWPQLLPGSRAVLFTGWSRNLDDSFIAVLRLDTKEKRILIQGGTDARYLPSGHLVYARSGNLLAVPFDADKLQVTGDPIPVGEGAGVSLSYEGNAQFSVSRAGSLVFIPGGLQGSNRTLVWMDRNGHEQPLPAPPRDYIEPRLSPDGQRIAVVISGAEDDIWIYDIARQAMTKFTSGARSLNPVWTPDGKRIIFRSARAGALNLFWKPADGSGAEERLTTSQTNQTPTNVSPDGQWLLFRDNAKGGVLMLPLNAEDRKPQLLIEIPVINGFGGTFSPDGSWVAYSSAESGRDEVYVRPFPSGAGKLQVSTNGGSQPIWGRTDEIFYREADKMMAVQVIPQPTLSVGKPHELFKFPYVATGANVPSLGADGRFLMLKAGEQEQSGSQINVVLNWSEELKRRVPGK